MEVADKFTVEPFRRVEEGARVLAEENKTACSEQAGQAEIF